MPKIIRNWAKCRKCRDVIESTYRHDFVKCKCGAIFVDGGHDYYRRGFDKAENLIELDDEGREVELDNEGNEFKD